MIDTQSQSKMISDRNQSSDVTGTLLVPAGGKGIQATDKALHMLWDRYFESPLYTISFDTDSSESTSSDLHVDLGMSYEEIVALKANADRFAPVVGKIFGKVGHMFGAVESRFGARTTGAMTQVMWEFRMPEIIRALRKGIDHLMQSCHRIRIYIVHSTGGGSGRAISILLPILLADATMRRKVTFGYHTGVIEPPISISGFPITHARHDATELQMRKILSNHVAWALESDELLRHQKLAYAVHVGYSNSSAVNNTANKLTDVMANTVYDMVVNFPYFNARMVDSVPSVNTPYGGCDSPSDKVPSVAEVRNRIYKNKG